VSKLDRTAGGREVIRSKKEQQEELLRTLETITIVLRPEVWANLPFNEEGHPDFDQIEEWKDLERREEAEEWFDAHGYE
jgi:hypothetical protein